MGNVPPSKLRRPPPPSKVRSRRRRCKKANPSNSMIDSLSDDLLIEILLRLSADEIYDKARLVCRRWCNLIHSDAFVQTHLHRASSGLLLIPYYGLHHSRDSSPVFMTATMQGRVQMSSLSCRIKYTVLCSCNGLALCLMEDKYQRKGPFIFNPATKCAFNLHPSRSFMAAPVLHGLGIAYAAASMAYKVFGSYLNSQGVAKCVILTVGVDNTWRNVDGLSPEARRLLKDVCTPLITGCFVHWVSKTHVVSLNVETETSTLTPTPESKDGYCHLSAGEYLSMFVPRGDWSWEVWELKPDTWQWRKVLPCLDLEAHKCKIQQFALEKGGVLEPAGWVRYPKVLAFLLVTSRTCIIYKLDTDELECIELSFLVDYHSVEVVQHRNSLVWSEWC